jgi:hypothetical protein
MTWASGSTVTCVTEGRAECGGVSVKLKCRRRLSSCRLKCGVPMRG